MTPNFKLAEFTRSRKAAECGIRNEPNIPETNNLKLLAEQLETLRELWGGFAFRITSGFRCKGLNDAVGGSRSSFHLSGRAADFVLTDSVYDRLSLDRLLIEKYHQTLAELTAGDLHLDFAEFYLELDTRKERPRWWIHFAIPVGSESRCVGFMRNGEFVGGGPR